MPPAIRNRITKILSKHQRSRISHKIHVGWVKMLMDILFKQVHHYKAIFLFRGSTRIKGVTAFSVYIILSCDRSFKGKRSFSWAPVRWILGTLRAGLSSRSHFPRESWPFSIADSNNNMVFLLQRSDVWETYLGKVGFFSEFLLHSQKQRNYTMQFL